MNISIKVIPHKEQRYEGTPGDWWFDEYGDLQIRASDMGDWRYNALMSFHELAEVLISKHHGITVEEVDEHDIRYFKEMQAGLHEKWQECGDALDCPCRQEHSMATALERALSVSLDVSWKEYDDAVNNLS